MSLNSRNKSKISLHKYAFKKTPRDLAIGTQQLTFSAPDSSQGIEGTGDSRHSPSIIERYFIFTPGLLSLNQII